MRRRDARELIIKTLFACDIEKGDPLRQLAYIVGDWEMAGFDEERPGLVLTGAEEEYTKRLASGVLSHKAELDEIIGRYSVDWEPGRLGGAERAILRMGLYEMLYDEKLPPAIVINEALDLVRKYGNPEAAGFINGVLGKKAEEVKAEEVKAEK